MSERKGTVWQRMCIIGMTLALYVGAYAILVDKEFFIPFGIWFKDMPMPHEPKYSYIEPVNTFLRRFFYPVHLVDRKIRNEYWNPLYQDNSPGAISVHDLVPGQFKED